MNYLMCSVGRRGELLKDFRLSMETGSTIVATDISPYAPALYLADKQYIVPRIDAPDYIDVIINICKKESINAVMTFIDPEIMILAKARERFSEIGVEVLVPYAETARICFDKYVMSQYLIKNHIKTIPTWGTYEDAEKAIENGSLSFPVFVKPREGSGSVGARKVFNLTELKASFEQDASLIVQKLMEGIDLDADVYIDTISHEPVAIFSKKKLSTKIGGADKTISFKDDRLFMFIKDALKYFKFNGPIDMDFFYENGEYYLSEVNPRFGGAYLHAYGAGVDFIKLIEHNLRGNINDEQIGNYEDGVVMMMYDSVVIVKQEELIK